MANTLTNLIPTLYEALDVVSRELVGFIPAVNRDSGADRAAVGQTVYSHVAPPSTASNVTPGVTAPNDGDQTVGNVALSITKARYVPIRWNGEEQKGVNSGAGYNSIRVNQFAQGMRTLVNEIEVDVAQVAYKAASRAYGTAGTTPFATPGDYTDASFARKILVDNGAPTGDMQLVLNTAAGANVRGKQGGRGANLEGTDAILRQGVLLDIHGFSVRESAQAANVTKGTGASYTTNTAGYAVGATVITLITGTGTVNAGDVVTFAGDTNKYVVASGTAAPGAITLAAPGLLQAIPASATALTVGNSYAANMAFDRNAIWLATRAPAIPEEGDMAEDAMIITDPKSGLSFEVRLYKQYRQIRYEIAAAWGTGAVKAAHIATLLG
ncbi:P22 phage major capsid protein family protein [Lysobacter sp. HA35]